MNESDEWSVPYEEVPKDEHSVKKEIHDIEGKGVIQAAGCPIIST